MPATNENSLMQAVKSRKKAPLPVDSEGLLQMILAQITKVADHFAEDKNQNVTTQESHRP